MEKWKVSLIDEDHNEEAAGILDLVERSRDAQLAGLIKLADEKNAALKSAMIQEWPNLDDKKDAISRLADEHGEIERRIAGLKNGDEFGYN